jgi:hypothetical protein
MRSSIERFVGAAPEWSYPGPVPGLGQSLRSRRLLLLRRSTVAERLVLTIRTEVTDLVAATATLRGSAPAHPLDLWLRRS